MSNQSSDFDTVTDVLRRRCGQITVATLAHGQVITIHNVAWGRDAGERFDHVTTNISPYPECDHSVDFFTTDKVVSLVDASSGEVLYQQTPERS